MLDILKSHYKTVGKFTLVGIVNTIIDFSVFFILYKLLGIFFLFAHVCAFLVALVNSFYFNATWTFKKLDKDNFTRQVSLFVVVGLIGLILSTITIYFAQFFMWVFFAKILATIISFIWNYMASYFFVFNKKGNDI